MSLIRTPPIRLADRLEAAVRPRPPRLLGWSIAGLVSLGLWAAAAAALKAVL